MPALFLLLAWLLPLSVAIAEDGELVFSPLPMESTKTVLKQNLPMLAYLEKQTGRSISVDYSTDYAEILRKFQQGIIDLAYLGPLPYVSLSAAYPQVVPLVRFLNARGEDTYTCSLVGFNDPAFKPEALAGKRIALTQPLSTCGYLSTSALLRKYGVDIEQTRYRYTGSHSEVALGVVRGEFDAGGLKTAIGRKYGHLGLKLFKQTQPLPGFVLVANGKTVSPELRQSLRQHLTALKPLQRETDAGITADWGKNLRFGAVVASDADFEGVRQTLKGINIPEQGNF